jgi:hypothetical protein
MNELIKSIGSMEAEKKKDKEVFRFSWPESGCGTSS